MRGCLTVGKKNSLTSDSQLLMMLIPGVLLFFVFRYIPLGFTVVAFKDYDIFRGVMESPWVGLKHFRHLFADEKFASIFTNTIIITFMKMFLYFPIPIGLALLLNEMRGKWSRNAAQNLLYLPHFLSWAVIYGIFWNFFSHGGVANRILASFGGEPLLFFSDPQLFRPLLVITEAWRESGWHSILYMAALAGIPRELYESAHVDGASKLRTILTINLPLLIPTIVTVVILRLGNIMQDNFMQIVMMYNPAVYSTGDIMRTYIFREGVGRLDLSYSTAVGLFESVVMLVLVLLTNRFARKTTGNGIW